MTAETPSPGGQSLRGIIPPLVTPLAGRDELDVAGLERLIEHVLAGGVHGVFILGTTGEASALSDRLRRELIARTCRQVGARVPVLVGVTDTCVSAALALARFAGAAGATAVVTSTPYYLPLEQADVYHHARTIAAEQPLPVVLYNIPFLTRTAYAPDTLRRLGELAQIVGIKDSSGDLAGLRELRAAVNRERWSLFVGAEELLVEGVRLGADGGVCGGGNVDPLLFVDLFDAAESGDHARIDRLTRRLAVFDRIYRTRSGVAASIRGIKCALACRGICGELMAEPFGVCDPRERAAIRACLETLGLLRSSVSNHRTAPAGQTAPGDAREADGWSARIE